MPTNRTTQELEPARPRLLRASQSGGLREPASKQLWLDAWADPVAGVGAFSSCVTTCNLFGDGDWRLVVADADKKLKVWKGTQRASEHELLGVPVAVCAFLADMAPPRLPTLAVAAGPHVFMFKSLRPQFKFTVPAAGACAEEEAVWQSIQAGQVSAAAGAQQLQQLRQQQAAGVQLAERSLQLLSLSDAAAQQEFAASSGGQASSSTSCITCMDVIRQMADQPEGVGQLVLGTEDARVLLLAPGCTAVSTTVALPAVPALMAVSGGFDVGYRVVVAGRDGRLYSIRAGGLSSSVIQLDSQPVGLVCLHKQVVVGTMADELQCYSATGAKQYALRMPASIVTLQLLAASSPRMTPCRCVVVGLANGEVRLYNDRALLSVHSCGSGPVGALYAGRYAREDNSLVAVTATGALDIKIMPRSVNLEASSVAGGLVGPPPEQEVPLDVPKKTRLYVEQTQREVAHGVDMHRVFQRDLVKMRLATARALVKVLTDGQGAHAAAASLSMSVSIQGLGPRFRLLISLCNEGQELATDLQVLVQAADPSLYRVHAPHFIVPNLVPLLQYVYQADVTCLQPEHGAGTLQVIVVGSSIRQAPLMTALVSMPLSEADD